MKPCPECGIQIANDAKWHRCGWKELERGERPFVLCAHEGCPTKAEIRQKTPNGWANFCIKHYYAYHGDRAKAACAARGLNTVDQMKTDFLSMSKDFAKQLEEGCSDVHP